MERVFNFAAGPSALPLPVLEQAQRELLCYPGAGCSVMEMSHRSSAFQEIAAKAEENLRRLIDVYKRQAQAPAGGDRREGRRRPSVFPDHPARHLSLIHS